MKPKRMEEFLVKGRQGCFRSGVSYTTLSCNVPPILIFNGANAVFLDLEG